MERKGIFYVLGNWLKINGKRNLMRKKTVFFLLDEDTRGGKWIKCFVWNWKKNYLRWVKLKLFPYRLFHVVKASHFFFNILLSYIRVYSFFLFQFTFFFIFLYFIPPYFSFMQLFFYSEERTKIHFTLFFSFFFLTSFRENNLVYFFIFNFFNSLIFIALWCKTWHYFNCLTL